MNLRILFKSCVCTHINACTHTCTQDSSFDNSWLCILCKSWSLYSWYLVYDENIFKAGKSGWYLYKQFQKTHTHTHTCWLIITQHDLKYEPRKSKLNIGTPWKNILAWRLGNVGITLISWKFIQNYSWPV